MFECYIPADPVAPGAPGGPDGPGPPGPPGAPCPPGKPVAPCGPGKPWKFKNSSITECNLHMVDLAVSKIGFFKIQVIKRSTFLDWFYFLEPESLN